jgi:hypothetical protein
MKNTLTWLLVAATITLVVVCVVQSRKSAGQQTQMASLRGELEVQSQQIEDLQATQKRAEGQRRRLMAQADELAARLRDRESAATNVIALAPTNPPPVSEGEKPGEGKGGFGTMLSKLMRDPDTRKFIRDQQRMTMGQLYAPLVKQMGLAPDEAAKFKDLLADTMMNAAEKATSMFGGSPSTNRSEMLSNLSAEQKTFEEQVKAFLGDDRYAQYKDYEQTLGERAMLNQFKQQAGTDYNLTDPQTEALLTIIKEEKKNVAATTGLPLGDANKDPAKLQALLADGKMDELLQGQDAVSQRVYDRARTILSPDQLNTFGKFQTNQMQMMRLSLSMAKKMFAPDKPTPAAAPPNQ